MKDFFGEKMVENIELYLKEMQQTLGMNNKKL